MCIVGAYHGIIPLGMDDLDVCFWSVASCVDWFTIICPLINFTLQLNNFKPTDYKSYNKDGFNSASVGVKLFNCPHITHSGMPQTKTALLCGVFSHSVWQNASSAIQCDHSLRLTCIVE